MVVAAKLPTLATWKWACKQSRFTSLGKLWWLVISYQLSVFSYQRRGRDFVALRNEAVRYAHFELKPHNSRRLRRTSLLTTDY